MTTLTFEPGAIVRLKSGGPNMTVVRRETDPTNISGLPIYLCEWFDNKKRVTEYFASTSLVPADVSSSG
jgi:uncharacterized protein YodC (DUF2158 family)